MVQGWWEGSEYYDYSTAYCGEEDEDEDDKDRRKRMDDREEFDECQSYTQVRGGVNEGGKEGRMNRGRREEGRERRGRGGEKRLGSIKD